MDEIANRIHHLKGSPREVGFTLGQKLGKRLEDNIDRYINTGPAKYGFLDIDKLRTGALSWLRNLPQRFQDELEGIAEGASVPLQRIAEWSFAEKCADPGCTGVIYKLNGNTWVARNNDTWAPELWGYASIREIEGRIPTISFGLEGDVFTSTGINKERLWLHFNHLPAHDNPNENNPHLTAYIWLTEALETCRSLDDVENLLSETERENGMMLFAIDGKTDDFTVFECTCTRHRRRESTEHWIAGTNHYCTDICHQVHDKNHTISLSRLKRVEIGLAQLENRRTKKDTHIELRNILADIEVRGEKYFTVFANIACPAREEIWYTFGGYPAASTGRWHQLSWPW